MFSKRWTLLLHHIELSIKKHSILKIHESHIPLVVFLPKFISLPLSLSSHLIFCSILHFYTFLKNCCQRVKKFTTSLDFWKHQWVVKCVFYFEYESIPSFQLKNFFEFSTRFSPLSRISLWPGLAWTFVLNFPKNDVTKLFFLHWAYLRKKGKFWIIPIKEEIKTLWNSNI